MRFRSGLALAALAATGALTVFATTPASHDVTLPTTPGQVVVVEWTGTAAPGAAGGNNTCSTFGSGDPTRDGHIVNLTVPDGAYDNVTVAAAFHVEWDDPVSDLVLSVEYEGDNVGDSDGGEPQENVSVTNPQAGEFEAAVCAFAAASPTAFRGKLTLTAAEILRDADMDGVSDADDNCPDTPRYTLVEDDGCTFQRPAGMPWYYNHQAPEGVASAVGEPSIGCNWLTEQTFTNTNVDGSTNSIPNGGTTTFFGGFSPVMLKITFDDCSSPARAVWEEKPLLASSTPRALGDPILFTDHDTGRTWVVQLEPGGGATIDVTDNDGDDFVPSSGPFTSANDFDHETIGSGPYHAPLTGTNPLYENAVYYAVQGVSEAVSFRSDDGGMTFNAKVPMYTAADCTGLHGHVKVSPADGTVYVPPRACAVAGVPLVNGGNAGLVVSEDNGLTWSVRPVNHPQGAASQTDDPSVGVATDGTIYMGYHGIDGHPWIAVSHDRGLTWSVPKDVGQSVVTGKPVLNMAFAEVVAGDPDRAAFAFFGTETAGADAESPGFPGVWYLYVATTFDAGATWTTQNISPGDPIQRGGICGGGTCRNLLDFFDATIDKEGRVLIAGEDGCISQACIDGGPNDFTAKGFIGRQAGGKRMFAAFDPVEPARPGAPAIGGTLNEDSTAANLAWGVPDTGASPITSYKVYRREGASGPFALLATVPGTSYTDTTYDNAAETFYHVTAVNAVGEGPYCLDFRPTAIEVLSPCTLPGLTILTDGKGDALDEVAAHDVHRLSIAEPIDVAPDKLVFTLKVASLATVPPDTHWPVQFNVGGTTYTARMSTFPPGTSVTPVFQYFQGALNAAAPATTTADAASTFLADGTIRIVVPRSGIGSPAVASDLTSFLTRIQASLGAASITPDNMPDGLAPSGSYTVVGNDFCALNTNPVAKLSAGPKAGAVPLTVEFDASLSFDPDNGDTIASYVFDFGDERGAEQATPTVSHNYTEPGTYIAVVRVRDNRGLSSNNVAEQVITVTGDAKVDIGDTRLGGSLSALGVLVLGLAALRRRRRTACKR